MPNILITAPSLNEHLNISGISSLTKTIINNNSIRQNYFHFIIGKKDTEGKGLKWAATQLSLIPRFIAYVRKHNIDLVHLNTDLTPFSIIRDYMVMMTARNVLRKEVVLHIHGGYMLMSAPPKKSIFYILIKRMLQRSARSIVLSEIEQRKVFSHYHISPSIMPNAVEVIGNQKKKDFTGKLTLLFMGRIVKAKGIFLITECLKELTEYFDAMELKVYGTGPELPAFLSEIEKIKGLNFEYGGVAKGAGKHQALKEAHIFLLPSLYGEGLPIAMLESMNYGCVPLVSDDASIGTVVKDGHNGCLINRGNHYQLKQKLVHLLSNRKDLDLLSNNARETINRSYNLENYIEKLNLLYQKPQTT